MAYWILFRTAIRKKFDTPDEMKKLKWDPVWKYWFEKMGVLENKKRSGFTGTF